MGAIPVAHVFKASYLVDEGPLNILQLLDVGFSSLDLTMVLYRIIPKVAQKIKTDE